MISITIIISITERFRGFGFRGHGGYDCYD